MPAINEGVRDITEDRVKEIALILHRKSLENQGSEKWVEPIRVIAEEIGLSDEDMISFRQFIGKHRIEADKLVSL
jgi:hypothetical protein